MFAPANGHAVREVAGFVISQKAGQREPTKSDVTRMPMKHDSITVVGKSRTGDEFHGL